MPGFIASLKDSVLGKEENLPIISFPRKKTIDVFYTYYEGKPQSHRLEFRKGKRITFEMFLPRYGKNILELCSAGEDEEYCKAGGETVFGFWSRLALRLFAGKLISCCDISSGPNSEIHTQFGEASSAIRYRFANCRKGAEESIVLVSSRHTSQSSTYRQGQKTNFNWVKMSSGEFRKLVESLRSFIGSPEFLKGEEQRKTE